jgi:hypothetical protein
MASSAEDLLLSAGLGDFDPTAWWGNDLSWLDSLDMGSMSGVPTMPGATIGGLSMDGTGTGNGAGNGNSNSNGTGNNGAGGNPPGVAGMISAGQAEF